MCVCIKSQVTDGSGCVLVFGYIYIFYALLALRDFDFDSVVCRVRRWILSEVICGRFRLLLKLD